MSEEKYRVDPEELLRQRMEEMHNNILIGLLSAFTPDDLPGREMFFKLLRAANKHGVSTQTMLDILQELKPEGPSNG